MRNPYRKLAEEFGLEGTGDLRNFYRTLVKIMETLPEETAEKIERPLVEHLENALGDVFGLEQAFEAALVCEKCGGVEAIHGMRPAERCVCGMDPAGGFGLKSHE